MDTFPDANPAGILWSRGIRSGGLKRIPKATLNPAQLVYATKVDADRQLDLATLPGYFCDEVLRWLLHGNSLRLLRRTCS